ncbi:MAG TPA: prolyl oligopeptidase family serine peptidase [Phycisphaerales bacterium]|nr:prolyl oligopeptidase family serine peptidase [Phycisphaerales bacterium]
MNRPLALVCCCTLLGAMAGCDPSSPMSSGVTRPGGAPAAPTASVASIARPRPFQAPPATERRPVVDVLHGVRIVDDYRWLEDWNSPAVQAWSDKQNAYARSYLDTMKCAEAARARMTELENAVGVQYRAVKFTGGKFFATKVQPPKQQPLIVVLDSIDNTRGERVILDPNELDKTGHTAYDWFVPSPDGALVAVSLSEGGSESGNVHVYSTDDGRELLGDVVPRVNGGTAGGSLAWNADGSGFFYTRYPREGERPKDDMDFYTQVWHHDMGRPTEHDTYETGKDFPKIAEIALEVSHDGKWVLCNVQNGDGGEFIQEVRSLAPDAVGWNRLSTYADRIVEAKFGRDSALYLVSRKNAPMGKVLRLALDPKVGPGLGAASEIVHEQKDASVETTFSERNGLWLTDNRLYVLYQIGGPNELRQFDLSGKPLGSIPQPDISTLEGVEPLTGDDLVYQIDMFESPPAYFHYVPSATGGTSTKTALVVADPPNMPRLTVKREFATSKDGTRVPVNIIMPAGLKPNGKTPTIVWGYGGYGVNETPGFSVRRLLWLEQGNIFVVANIRGGGEYGEAWHLQGNLLNKQNVFDDFYAAARHMIDKGYTDHEHLGIFGGSNGGLLMGATFTQHPSLAKAVVSSVGIYDMLRVELSSNGEFNITEFGTVKNKAQFDALYAYSPYHHVKNGVDYPAMLFLTGANDPRVDPMQSRKMIARLQAADPTGLFILRTSGNTGHGMGTPLSARIEQSVDTYGFFFEQLGAPYRPIGSPNR